MVLHALVALSFVVILIGPCVLAGQVDLDAEEANANCREMDANFRPRE